MKIIKCDYSNGFDAHCGEAVAARDRGRQAGALAGLKRYDNNKANGQNDLNDRQNSIQNSHNSSKSIMTPFFIGRRQAGISQIALKQQKL